LFAITLTASSSSGNVADTEKTVTLILMVLDFMIFSITHYFPLYR